MMKDAPKPVLEQLKNPKLVAFSSLDLPWLSPRVLVKVGDVIELGQPLVEHKKDDRIKLTSPAAGRVHEVRFGPRRTLEAVVVAIDENKEANTEKTATFSFDDLALLSRDQVAETLLRHGFWAYLDCFPGRGFAPLLGREIGEKDSIEIKAVHINLTKAEPHWPDESFVIKDRLLELKAGIVALSRLGKTTRAYVPKGSNLSDELSRIASVVEVVQKYPAENLGVQAWYAGGLKKQQCVIGAQAELVIDIGHLLLHGQKRIERIYCLAGNAVKKPRHVQSRQGIAVGVFGFGSLISTEDVRLLAGGLLNGRKVRFQDFLGLKDLSLLAIIEDKKRIPFSFFRLGSDRLTMAPTWLSYFNKNLQLEVSTNNNGEERACIQCGYCIEACPVDLMPNLIMKAAKTKDIEQMEWLSINDCVECGLCTFVCPSKIELGTEIELGKSRLEKEG